MSKKLKNFLCVILLVFIMFPATAFSVANYPEPTAQFFVNDFADVLSSGAESQIINVGKQLEDKTGAQVVIVTVKSLEGMDIEEYAVELGRKWGIGQKDKNNGVLLLNAVEERELDIEVGYGLEGAIPDIRAKEIIDDHIIPYVKNGDYDNGLINGYNELVKDVSAEYGVAVEAVPEGTRNEEQKTVPLERNSRGFDFRILIIIGLLAMDGIFFRFRITSALIKIIFWSRIFGEAAEAVVEADGEVPAGVASEEVVHPAAEVVLVEAAAVESIDEEDLTCGIL